MVFCPGSPAGNGSHAQDCVLDSEKIFYDSLKYSLNQHNFKPDICLQGLFGLTVEETLAHLKIDPNSPIGSTWEKCFDKLCRQASFYDGIQDTFRILHTQNAHISIVTSRNHSTVDPIWKESVLSPYIDFCVAAEDTDKHKPNPAPLLFAITSQNLDPCSTIYIGDTMNDFIAAKKAGISFAAATWNTNASSLPGVVISSPIDLVHLL